MNLEHSTVGLQPDMYVRVARRYLPHRPLEDEQPLLVEDENELPSRSPVFVEQLLHPSAHPEPETNGLVLLLLHLDLLSPDARRHLEASYASHQLCVDL